MKTKKYLIAELVHDPKNTKVRSDEELQTIAAMLRKFGQRSPIVVEEGTNIICKGNGTTQAAREILGWTHIIGTPAKFASEAERIAYSVGDNASGETGWDSAMLRELHSSGMLAQLDDDPSLKGMLDSLESELQAIEPPSTEAPPPPPAPPGGSVGGQRLTLQYQLVFDDHAQQTEFMACLRKLKTRWPDPELTIAARLMRVLRTDEENRTAVVERPPAPAN